MTKDFDPVQELRLRAAVDDLHRRQDAERAREEAVAAKGGHELLADAIAASRERQAAVLRQYGLGPGGRVLTGRPRATYDVHAKPVKPEPDRRSGSEKAKAEVAEFYRRTAERERLERPGPFRGY